jgi:hypothetical protein
MTTKAEFNADEWSQIAVGPFVAGLTVIAADRGGTVRESVEMARVIAEEQQAGENPELIAELLRERPDPQALLGGDGDKPSAEDLPVRAEQILREALTTLAAKATPEEVEAYKRLCLEIAQRVAERTKSGGVLGIGGEKVSADEQQALARLHAILGT